MKKNSNEICLFMGIGLVLGISIIILIMYYTVGYQPPLEELFLIIGCLGLELILIISVYYYNKLFNSKFLEEYIGLRWAKFTYKKILYDDIRIIVIMAAVDGAYYPIYNHFGKRMAALSLHTSESLFLSAMFPNGFSIMPLERLNKDILGCVLFDISSFQILVKKTNVPIFITQEMLSLYKEELKVIFSECPDRVRVSCYMDSREQFQIIPYNQLNME